MSTIFNAALNMDEAKVKEILAKPGGKSAWKTMLQYMDIESRIGDSVQGWTWYGTEENPTFVECEATGAPTQDVALLHKNGRTIRVQIWVAKMIFGCLEMVEDLFDDMFDDEVAKYLRPSAPEADPEDEDESSDAWVMTVWSSR